MSSIPGFGAPGLVLQINDVEAVHNISIRTGFHGEVKHVVIFMDKKANTFAWVTGDAGLAFKEGELYDVVVRTTDDPRRVTHVKDITGKAHSYKEVSKAIDETPELKSEQPDAVDVIMGKANYRYVLDKRLKI